MTCDRYRPMLALLVGNDLDPREAADVRQHVIGCASCQAQWKALENSMAALQVVSQKTITPAPRNLWPELSRRLGTRPSVAHEPAPGWMTLGAFTAACAAVLWLTVSAPVFDFEMGEAQVVEANPSQLMPPLPSGSQFGPQVQFVNDTDPAIPFRFAPDGTIESPMGQVSSPMFGGPRSF